MDQLSLTLAVRNKADEANQPILPPEEPIDDNPTLVPTYDGDGDSPVTGENGTDESESSTQIFTLRMPGTLTRRDPHRYKDMARARLDAYIEAVTERLAEKRALLPRDPAAVAKWETYLRKAQTERFRRWGATLAPLFFLVLGIPLGLVLRQENKLVAVTVGLVVVSVTWTPLEQVFMKLGLEGDAPPWLVLVMPNLSLLILAGVLQWLLRVGVDVAGGVAWLRERAVNLFRFRRRNALPKHLAETTLMLGVPPPPKPAHKRAGRLYRIWRMLVAGVIGSPTDRHLYRMLLSSLLLTAVAVSAIYLTLNFLVNIDYFTTQAEFYNRHEIDQLDLPLVTSHDPASGEAVTVGSLDVSSLLSDRPTPPALVSPVQLGAEIFTLRLPLDLSMFAPLIVLVAVLFTVARMLGKNEFLVLKAGGVSVHRALRPMYVFAMVIAVGLISFNQWGVPRVVEWVNQRQAKMDRKAGYQHLAVMDTKGRLMWSSHYHVRTQRADGVIQIDWPPRRVVTLDTPATAVDWPIIRVAEFAQYLPGRGVWALGPGREFAFTSQSSLGGETYRDLNVVREFGQPPPPDFDAIVADPQIVRDFPATVLPFNLGPNDMGARNRQLFDEMAIGEMWQLCRDNPSWTAPRVQLHRKFIQPLAAFALILICVPLIINVQRGAVFRGLALGFLLSLVFYTAIITLSGLALGMAVDWIALVLWGGMSPFLVTGMFLTFFMRT